MITGSAKTGHSDNEDIEAARVRRPLKKWLLADTAAAPGEHVGPHGQPDESRRRSWWQVMCLTGVDYFSTLGYQPAIAALAAGVIAPLATVVLVIVTLAGALPVYRRVAEESARGAGSIAMLAKMLPKWGGKLVILALLGFAATDFMITMTLSAADATAHLVENPFAPAALQGHEVGITLVFLALLGAVFLRGFREAIGIATAIVGVFLALNVVVVSVALAHVFTTPLVVDNWWSALTTQHGDPLLIIAFALLVFPKLALGLSGFETGVAVMPQIRGDAGDTDDLPAGRIRGAKRLLTTSALIMSAFLVTSSLSTVILIPAAEFEPGGAANGRALAYLAHQFLGEGFGTAYDIATIAILWFAGASAMAGLLNLVPRFLPRLGMAPSWARAIRPLTLVFMAIAFLITLVFQADVNAQGGAYATGVLVLITSAALAVTLVARRRGQRGATIGFGTVTGVFVFTTIANIIERPEGIKIAGLFILGILVVSFVSRLGRAFEVRATDVTFDAAAREYLAGPADRPLRLIAHEPADRSRDRYQAKLRHARLANHLPASGTPVGDVLFIEVRPGDSSDFEEVLEVRGRLEYGHRVLEVSSGNVPNTIAAILLAIRDETGRMPHVYFRWAEGRPVSNFARFFLFGEGQIAPLTREVLRLAEPDIARRPWVHVG